MNYLTFSALLNFLLYIAVSGALLVVFTWVYIKVTPYNEMEQIKRGMKAPATALVGAMVGFTMPLLAMSLYGLNLTDFVVWAVVAMLVQLFVFKLLYWLIPGQIEADNQATAIFFAGMSVCVGAINAFSLIPH